MKIGIVVQRYGLEVNGGAELHARYIAEHLAERHTVHVYTTRARDYVTWKNAYPGGESKLGPVTLFRFGVKRPRNPDRYGAFERELLARSHTRDEELKWLELEGPFSPDLVRTVGRRSRDYDAWIFFSFRYYTTFHGLMNAGPATFLVPTAEDDPIIHFQIFRDLFHRPLGIFYNSIEEKRMIQGIHRNYSVDNVVVGVGVEVPSEPDPRRFRLKYHLHDPFILYIGRLDANKGVENLVNWFRDYVQRHRQDRLHLVLIGSQVIPLPDHPRIRKLGFVDDQTKFDALAACELLVNPSPLESLSMIVLEAWALKKAVLVNGRCPVLKGQVIRSNGGLYYENKAEFEAMLNWLRQHPTETRAMGYAGHTYYTRHYRWPVIMEKYDRLLSRVHQLQLKTAS